MLYSDPNDNYTGPGTVSAPPPTPALPTPPGTVQTTPGYTPDYNALLQNDPGYQAAQSAAQKAQAQAAAARKQSLQQALIQYGGKLPAGFTDQYGDIDQANLDLAKNNQYSTLSNLAKNYAQNEEQFKRSLAARGMLQSGDLNYGENQLQNAYGQQQYDAANVIGSQVNQSLQGYTNVLDQNAQSLSGAIQGAESNVYNNPAYKPVEAQSANYDAHNSAAYGQPIYVDSSGNLYDQGGNPFTPPAPSSGGGGGGGGDAYVPGPTDSNGLPISAGFYGFDANGNWIG